MSPRAPQQRSVSGSSALLLVSVVAVALMVLGVDARSWAPDHSGVLDWRLPLAEVEAALAAGDPSRAVAPWREARRRALAARQWEGLLEVGAAYRRLGAAGGFADDALTTTRELFIAAMSRARGDHSLEGVLRAGDAFAEIGDREMVATCHGEAQALAGRDPAAQARVADAASRWHAAPSSPWRESRP